MINLSYGIPMDEANIFPVNKSENKMKFKLNKKLVQNFHFYLNLKSK